MLRHCAVLWLMVALVGCTKSAPEFYQIEADCSNLVSRESDEAYFAEEMDDILTRLRAIPPNVKEGPKVAALISTIEGERARIKKEKEDAAKAAVVVKVAEPPPEFLKVPSVVDAGEPVDAGVVDAGVKVPAPYAGMPEAEFLKHYGDCVEAGPSVKVPLTDSPGATQVLKKDEGCEKRLHGTGGDRSYVFVDGKLSGQMDRTVTEERKVQAPVPAPVDAGEPEARVRIFGAPMDVGQQ